MGTITKRKLKPRKPKVETETAPEFVLVDKQDRKKLGEGRNYGIAFGLCKRAGSTVELVGPISPCREYLNDQIAAELTKNPVSAHGYYGKHEGLLNDSLIFMAMAVLPYSYGGKYTNQDAETKRMAESYAAIQSLINKVEEMFKLEGRTRIIKVGDNRYLAISPVWWGQWTYLISLLSILVRIGLECKYGGDQDPIDFIAKSQGTDSCYGEDTARKIKKIAGGSLPAQDLKQGGYWHGRGIVNQSFP